MKLKQLAAGCLLAVAFVGCAPEEASVVPRTAPPMSDAVRTTVSISASRFEPVELVIAAGSTISFTNDDPFAHTVTARDGTFSSGRMEEGETFVMTFDDVGEVHYFCELHPTMRATVVVEG